MHPQIFLLGLATLGLFAFTPVESKADEGFRVYVNPGYQDYRPYFYGDDRYRYYHHADEYRWHQWQRRHRHHYDRDGDPGLIRCAFGSQTDSVT
jgi:hypothetical protein